MERQRSARERLPGNGCMAVLMSVNAAYACGEARRVCLCARVVHLARMYWFGQYKNERDSLASTFARIVQYSAYCMHVDDCFLLLGAILIHSHTLTHTHFIMGKIGSVQCERFRLCSVCARRVAALMLSAFAVRCVLYAKSSQLLLSILV